MKRMLSPTLIFLFPNEWRNTYVHMIAKMMFKPTHQELSTQCPHRRMDWPRKTQHTAHHTIRIKINSDDASIRCSNEFVVVLAAIPNGCRFSWRYRRSDENTKCNVQLLGIASGERDNKNNTQFTQVDEDFVPPIILCVTTKQQNKTKPLLL